MPKHNKQARVQLYRKEWEREAWAIGWLCPSRNTPGKAFCKFCGKDLVPGKSELEGHCVTDLHKANRRQIRTTTSMDDVIYTKDTSAGSTVPCWLMTVSRSLKKIGKRCQ